MATEHSDIALIVQSYVDKAIKDIKKLNENLDQLDASSLKAGKTGQEAFKRELGIIEKLKQSIKNLETRRDRANDVSRIQKYNNLLDQQRSKLNKLVDTNEKNNVVLGKLKGLTAGIFSALALREAARFTQEIGLMADALKQVQDPFDKLVRKAGKDSAGALEELRGSIKGTLSDLKLMQRAGQAMDAFTASGISADDAWKSTTKTLDFLYRYSIKFGKDLNTVLRTVFTGLQRGSTLFLDDVGIMIDQTDEMFRGLNPVEKKAKLVAVALEQMAQKSALLGEVQEGATVEQARLSAEFENFLAIIGSGVESPLAGFFKNLNDLLKDVTRSTSEQVAEFAKYRTETNNTISNTEKLLKSYEDLKAIQSPTKIEQEKLNKTIKDIADIIPGSVSAVNDYGEALGINTAAVKNFVSAQRELLKRTQEDVFSDIKSDIQSTIKELNLASITVKTFSDAIENIKPDPNRIIGGIFGTTDAEDVQKRTEKFRKSIGESAKEVSDASIKLNQLSQALSVFIDLSAATPDSLSAELKISTKDAESLIARFKELNSVVGGGEGNKGGGGKVNKGGDALKEQKVLAELRIANIKDEYERRLALIDYNFEQEKEKYKNNNAIITELEIKAQNERIEVYSDYIDNLKKRDQIYYEELIKLNDAKIALVKEIGEKELSEGIALADYLLQYWKFTEEKRAELLKLRGELVKEAGEAEIEQARRVAIVLDDVLGSPMRTMVSDLLTGTAKASKIWDNFLNNLKQKLADFAADQFVTNILGGIADFIFPGAGSFFTGLFAQEGAYIRPTQKGTPVIVGENNTEEVIVPTKRLKDFIAGNYTLPGGYGINNIPGLQLSTPQLNMPAFSAPAAPGPSGGNVTVNVPKSEYNDGNIVKELRSLREDVQVLQNQRLMLSGEDIYTSNERVKKKISGN